MPNSTRHIGLSLGADLCWPICYERILKDLDLRIDLGNEQVSFDVERVSIEPFDIRQPCKYDVVIDRVTHWYHTSREWIKKAVVMDDLYVYNNPWSIQSMEKQTTYCAMARLGFPVPETWMIPPKSYDDHSDLESTLSRYAKIFCLGETGEKVGYPMFMKPYDGGAWKGVSRIDDEETFRKTYETSGTYLMHIQESVEGFDRFVRCVGLGPQFLMVSYDPAAPLHDRYQIKNDFLNEDERSILEDMTVTINSFFGWDFNSCESLHRDGVWYPIDFANACPDSQVTSLHYHFPWIVMANLKWSIFCAATRRKFPRNLDWEPYYAINEKDIPFREKLSQYAALGHKRLETDRFHEFCEKHLSHLDQAVHDFFATDAARDAVHQKVMSLFPQHEVESFTQLFWDRIQQWRAENVVTA